MEEYASLNCKIKNRLSEVKALGAHSLDALLNDTTTHFLLTASGRLRQGTLT